MSVPYRSSLVISQPRPGEVIQQGDPGFEKELLRHYSEVETIALEQLHRLKSTLRRTSDEDFWFTFCDGLARIIDAQYCMVSKQVHDSPPIGDPDSCLTALCWYYDNGHGVQGAASNIVYHAFSCPCALMKHRKVLLIPERLNETFPENPNKLAFPAEAYLAIPVFDGDRYVAHLAVLWTLEALQRRKLSWGFVETLCHALEDLVLQRFLAGVNFPKQDVPPPDPATVPLETIAALHALKPFARNLSHELRTPMQGVVGMLDIMYATIGDAVRSKTTADTAIVFEELKDCLEVMQASAKRAIEASDNVVQAYALNMGLPEFALPTPPVDAPYIQNHAGLTSTVFSTSVPPRPISPNPQTSTSRHAVQDDHVQRGVKRPRDIPEDLEEDLAKSKRTSLDGASGHTRKREFEVAVPDGSVLTRSDKYSPSLLFGANSGPQYVNIRDVINFVVLESLKTIGLSASSTPVSTTHGQQVDVKSMLGNGAVRSKSLEWNVHPTVPELILVDERMLAKMLSCVFHNALKFTESGSIRLVAWFCQKRELVIISVRDTGPGIPEHFRKKIFKPFTREDDSTTRQNEGLGLGLLVAKGLSRKLGGDLVLLSSDTLGDHRGCEFEMRIPVSPGRSIKQSESPTPFAGGSESPSRVSSLPPIASQPHSSPSNSSSIASNHASPKPSTSLDICIDTDLKANLCLPHSPPLSPRCPTCSAVEDSYCPSTMPEKSLIQQPLEQTVEPILSTPTPRHIIPPPSSASLQALRVPVVPRRTSQLFDRNLAASHPLTFLVAEDNPINRKLLISMLTKLGYNPKTQIYEAYDGAEAVRKVQAATQDPGDGESSIKGPIDVVLMDLWMPAMDGYEATQRILGMFRPRRASTWRTMSAPDRLSIASVAGTKSTPLIAEAGVAEMESGSEARGEVKSPASADGDAVDSEDHEQQQRTARAWRTTLKARELLPPTILAVTADATDDAFEKAKSAGMEGFMMKPFRIKELERLVREGWARREKGLEAKKVNVLS